MGFRCFVNGSTGGTDSGASSPRSLASSKDDYDWDAVHEERLKEEREETLEALQRKNFLRGQYLLHAVLRTWRQLCSVDAEIVAAMYNQRSFSAHHKLRPPHQQKLLRNAFAVWRIYQWQDEEEDEGYDL